MKSSQYSRSISLQAVNQLTETHVPLTKSVWDLLQHESYSLSWLGTNAHFMSGMFGFSFLIGARVLIFHGPGILGMSAAGLAFSTLLLMTAIVNRGVSTGSGDGMRYGSNILSLFGRYSLGLVRRALRPDTFGFLELLSTLLLALCLLNVVKESFVVDR